MPLADQNASLVFHGEGSPLTKHEMEFRLMHRAAKGPEWAERIETKYREGGVVQEREIQ